MNCPIVPKPSVILTLKEILESGGDVEQPLPQFDLRDEHSQDIPVTYSMKSVW